MNKLLKQKKINLKQKLELTSTDNLAVIKGQPKTHKKDHPMRIITCPKNSIISNLSIQKSKGLRKIINNSITSTKEFV